jgi:N utilization substance protein B
MLFQIDVAGGTPVEIYPEFWREHEVEDEVRSFAEQLVEGVVREREHLDTLIGGAASNWRVDRMAVVDRNILRMASYELSYLLDTPAAVILDEAIEVGKRFGTEQSGAFINGVLDAVRREIARVRP